MVAMGILLCQSWQTLAKIANIIHRVEPFRIDGPASTCLAARCPPWYSRIMVRRTPKPFTVEVRKIGRASAVAAASSQDDSTLSSPPDDQPRVFWPGLSERSEPAILADPHAVTPGSATGRILPALGEAVPAETAPVPEQRRRGPNKPRPPKIKEVPPDAGAPAMLAPTPDEVAPAPAAPEPAAVEPVALAASLETLDVAPDAKAMAATLILRQGKRRLPRDEFKRGDRWKARLPAAVHRRQRY